VIFDFPYDFDGRVTLVIGTKRQGKDTVADMLAEFVPRTRKYGLTYKLKDIVAELYDFTPEQVHGAAKDVVDPRYGMTPREPLKRIGNEGAKSAYPLTWARYGLMQAAMMIGAVRVQPKEGDAGVGTSGKGSYVIDICDHVVLLDGRYVDEATAARSVGARIWRVRCPGFEPPADEGVHMSEREPYTPEMDAVVHVDIVNDGTLTTLRSKVQQAWAAGRPETRVVL